jgi:hypothetical protein
MCLDSSKENAVPGVCDRVKPRSPFVPESASEQTKSAIITDGTEIIN